MTLDRNSEGDQVYNTISDQDSRSIAGFACAAIGDALGTHCEFSDVAYGRKPSDYLVRGFQDGGFCTDRCNLGEFSDDTSMALCLADSIIACDYKFNGTDQMIKYINWWHLTYNNCLQPRKGSFGLGGNISTSFEDFCVRAAQTKVLHNNIHTLPQKCESKDKNANGNGSIMRLASVPIAFASDPDLFEKGKDFARKSSYVTHTGKEAAECCALLCHLTMKNISREKNTTMGYQEWVDIALSDFDTDDYSVNCIKNSMVEEDDEFKKRVDNGEYLKKFTKTSKDRNWNWKQKDFKYSPTREAIMPGYVGSYCLDALSMALHICYYYQTPSEGLLYAANMGGDCDSVAAVVGLVMGTFYGLDKEVLGLYDGVKNFDNYKCAYLGFKLYNDPTKFGLL
jgi:ADP-ribosylglycohydrolase